jgi:RNA polymerase sigma factor (sigma-70 family)
MDPRPDEIPSSRSLESWTRLLAQGDDAAWHWFHQRHYLALLRYAAQSCGNPSAAGDILQQAYLRIARHAKPFTEEDDFWHWLCCVVRSCAVDHVRQVSRRSALMERFALWRTSIVETEACRDPSGSTGSAIAEEALACLPAEDASILRRKYCDGFTTEELAAALGISSKAVEHRLARLREEVRAIILRIQ